MLVVSLKPYPSVTVRPATQRTPVLRAVFTVRPAPAPVVTVNVSPVAGTGSVSSHSRSQVNVQLPGVPGQLLPEASSAALSPAVMLTGWPGVISAVGGNVINCSANECECVVFLVVPG